MIDVNKLTSIQILALTGWAEARSTFVAGRGWMTSGADSMIGVMSTAVNRHKSDPARFGRTIGAVCLEHAQYSCWNPEAPHKQPDNHDALMAQADGLIAGRVVTDATLRECLLWADGLVNGSIGDRVNGATHYYAPESMIPPGRVPDWAVGQTPVAEIGGQLYFKGV